MDIYTAYFYIAAVFLTLACITFRIVKPYRSSFSSHLFTAMLWNICITSFICVIGEAAAAYKVPHYVEIYSGISMLYLALHALLAPLLANYVLVVTGVSGRFGTGSWSQLNFLPAAAAEVLVILNPFMNTMFSYDGATYHREWGTYALYFFIVYYACRAVMALYETRGLLNGQLWKQLRFFFLLVVVGLTMQALDPDFQIELFMESLTVLGMMLTIDRNDSFVDLATGLGNRTYYESCLYLYLNLGYRFNVINIRMLNLKKYLVTMSSVRRDQVIRGIADDLVDLAPGCEVFRYDQETFVILLKENGRKIGAGELIDRVKAYLSEDISCGDLTMDISSIMSTSRAPEDIDTVQGHLMLADYLEAPGISKVSVLEGESLRKFRRSVQVEQAIRRAIAGRGIQVHYQPIWDGDTGRISSCEALCRLEDRELGLITPGEFIPLAERNGMIGDIGDLVMERVCRDIVNYRLRDMGIKRVHVNLSLYQLMDTGVDVRYLNILDRYGVDPGMINLEITETMSADETPYFENVVKKLMSRGFSFSLDDYGTGYSNLSNVLNMKYSDIKLDASLLWNASDNSDARLVLETTIAMFRSMGLRVIQEGVEDRKQLKMVMDAGVNMVQGFYFSKPVPVEDLVRYLLEFEKDGNGRAM